MPTRNKQIVRARGHTSRLARTVGGLVLALGSVLSARAQSASEPLTLEQAVRTAQARSRQVAAQDAATTSARELAVAAGQLPDPVLKAGINSLPINGPDRFSLTSDFMTMRTVGVMQELTRSDKRRARAERMEREADVAEANRWLVLANLQRDTALAWFDRYYQERMRDALAVQRDEARLQIDAADVAYRGGRGPQADVFAARSAVAQIEDRIAQTERQVANAKTQLARWVGDAAAEPLAVLPNTDKAAMDIASLETVLAHHPQIAVMARQEEMALADVAVARANKHSDWSAEVMYSLRGPAYSNLVSINLSVPLQWDQKNRQDREVAARLAVAEQMRAQREEASREHVAEARMMLQEWQSDRERLTRYDSSLIPLSTERTRAALAAYRGGSGPLASVLEARRMEIDTRMERLRLEMDTARLWAQLNYLVPAGHGVVTPGPRPFGAQE